MNSILKALLKILPLKVVIKYIVQLFQQTVKDSKNKIDDYVYNIVDAIITEINFTGGNIEFTPEMQKLFDTIKKMIEKFSFSKVAQEVIDYLKERAKDTDTKFDDVTVDALEGIFIYIGIIEEEK